MTLARINSMDNPFPNRRTLVTWGVVLEGGLALLALGLGWLLGYPPLREFHATPADACWGAAAGGLMLLVIPLTLRLTVWPFSDVRRVVEELLVPMLRDCRWGDLLLIAALAGLGEEMLFRGVIQHAVEGSVGGPWGPWIGLAVASLLFGLVHFFSSGYVLLTVLMGLYLGGIWLAFDKNVLVPAMAHAVYDFLALAYLLKVRPLPPTTEVDEEPAGSE
jgi:membrane protease YdiL (CAAX protease family)